MNLNYEKSSIELPATWRARLPVFLLIGLVGVVGGAVLTFLEPTPEGTKASAFKYFAHSYLANFIYILSFSLGALFFILVQFLTRAGWSTSIRRIAEIKMTMIPFTALIFLPIVVSLFQGVSVPYGWNSATPENSVIAAKAEFYLTAPFFTVRTLIYFGLWILMGTWFYRLSRAQDESGDASLSLTRQKWSGPLVALFAISASGAAFDWIMSIDADWYSTILGVYLFSASMMGFFAMMIVISMTLQNAGKTNKFITVEHFHDMGKFMFGFVMFWSYIAFSQLVLIWYANIPEETEWYKVRLVDNWTYFSYGLIAVHFVIPFLFLMSRHIRRNRTLLFAGAIWVLVAHWLDMTYLVMPNAGPGAAHFFPLAGHLIGGVGMLFIFASIFILRASGVPLVAMRDPRLPESLTYANPIL